MGNERTIDALFEGEGDGYAMSILLDNTASNSDDAQGYLVVEELASGDTIATEVHSIQRSGQDITFDITDGVTTVSFAGVYDGESLFGNWITDARADGNGLLNRAVEVPTTPPPFGLGTYTGTALPGRETVTVTVTEFKTLQFNLGTSVKGTLKIDRNGASTTYAFEGRAPKNFMMPFVARSTQGQSLDIKLSLFKDSPSSVQWSGSITRLAKQ